MNGIEQNKSLKGYRVSPKDADGMAKSVDSDQADPKGAV